MGRQGKHEAPATESNRGWRLLNRRQRIVMALCGVTALGGGIVGAKAFESVKPKTKGTVTISEFFSVQTCLDYAKPVLPASTELCYDQTNELWVLLKDDDKAGHRILARLLQDDDPKTGELCLQTMPTAQKQWRICEREGNPYYFEKLPARDMSDISEYLDPAQPLESPSPQPPFVLPTPSPSATTLFS